MAQVVKGPRVAIEQYAAHASKAAGYPSRGVQVGGGIHVEIPETWDGTGPVPPGWTARFASVEEDPKTGEYVCPVYEGDLSKLTPAERTAVTTRNASKVDYEREPVELVVSAERA